MAKIKENPLAVKPGDISIEKSAPVHCSTDFSMALNEYVLSLWAAQLSKDIPPCCRKMANACREEFDRIRKEFGLI